MKMATLKYIFSLLFFLTTFSFSYGQKEDNDLYAPTKVKEPIQLKGIKFGVNVARFTDLQFKPERSSYEGSFDFNLSNKYFGVVEAGYSEINLDKDNYTYTSNGTFIKLGMDFNMLKKHPTDYLGVGFRIGRANFEQSANNILINDSHWPVNSFSINTKSYNTYWLEVSFGLKGELLKNVYFGWSALVRMAVSGRKDSQFQPYDIPGFGKTSSSVNLGANYYIYYQIPFKKNK